ncbi:hypothetical protein SAMD00023353_1601030 [Rosellinia necatrix]|uniref:Uncharacterized protein n=1 Tax=Rosellinia necatrix TaxID=77044 RepID=A0A1W2TIB4_ROSNE|nr:hypothetical protein SAMD00023353_1601030 [Rosellinia necatrix]
MKLSNLISSIALLAASVGQASPVANAPSEVLPARELEERQTASGCNYFAAPRCCVPTVCQCSNGWIYQLNQDNLNNGLHGCDPPWGFIAKSNSQFPGYCCREAEDGTLIEGVEP